MSLIQHVFFPRASFDTDFWLGSDSLLGPSSLAPISTLDVFDPFDELDRMLGRNIMWLDVPNVLRGAIDQVQQPRVPQKYRISLDCRNYRPSSIKTEISEDKTKLVVSGREGSAPKGQQQKQQPEEDFTLREFRRTFTLPPNVKLDEMVSFITKSGHLIIEIPMVVEKKKEEETRGQDDMVPRLVGGEGDQKFVEINMMLPSSIKPENVRVTCKDRDLIVQAEQKQEGADKSGQSQVFFYRRSLLPENTDFRELKCTWDKNQLRVRAPVDVNFERIASRSFPIEVVSGGEEQKQVEAQDEKRQLPKESTGGKQSKQSEEEKPEVRESEDVSIQEQSKPQKEVVNPEKQGKQAKGESWAEKAQKQKQQVEE